MKLSITCGQCMLDGIDPVAPFTTVIVRDDGRYDSVCPRGHNATTILQQQKFEVLFDLGAYAINDGYYREAVSSFTSSLERVYEFFVKASFFEKDKDDAFNEAWKEVKNQSERQLGAFIFIYTSEMRARPTLLNTNRVNFRNDVIHKGRIPTRDEALEYGQAVLDVVRPIISTAKERFPKGVSKTVEKHMALSRGVNVPTTGVVTQSIPTIISLVRDDAEFDKKPLTDLLPPLKDWTWRSFS